MYILFVSISINCCKEMTDRLLYEGHFKRNELRVKEKMSWRLNGDHELMRDPNLRILRLCGGDIFPLENMKEIRGKERGGEDNRC